MYTHARAHGRPRDAIMSDHRPTRAGRVRAAAGGEQECKRVEEGRSSPEITGSGYVYRDDGRTISEGSSKPDKSAGLPDYPRDKTRLDYRGIFCPLLGHL